MRFCPDRPSVESNISASALCRIIIIVVDSMQPLGGHNADIKMGTGTYDQVGHQYRCRRDGMEYVPTHGEWEAVCPSYISVATA